MTRPKVALTYPPHWSQLERSSFDALFDEYIQLAEHNGGSGLSAGPDAEKELREAWERLNREEIEKVVPKAIEYGASDLKVMGSAMRSLWKGKEETWTEQIGMEMACAFYALGKVARMFGAFERGELPSLDQAHDLGVYCRMIQLIRERGKWV